MAIVYTNPLYPYQVSFGGVKAASSQLDFRQMIGEVTQWNPNVDPTVAGRWINNYYRKIIDRRSWYGLKLKGFANVPNPTQDGQVTCTLGSATVTGVGTSWTAALVGQQFRTGFTYPYQTIVAVNIMAQTLQLDTPFVGPVGTNTTGYIIIQAYLNFGANIKRMKWAVNQQMGWPMAVNVPVETLNEYDVWRQSLGWSKVFATRAPAPDGSYIAECWPTPYSSQTFPFEAYQQPPDLVEDSDAPVAWIPSDLIVDRAVADALVFRGPRNNPYYDAMEAANRRKEFEVRIGEAEMADNDMDQQDVSWNYGQEDNGVLNGMGSAFSQSHDI